MNMQILSLKKLRLSVVCACLCAFSSQGFAQDERVDEEPTSEESSFVETRHSWKSLWGTSASMVLVADKPEVLEQACEVVDRIVSVDGKSLDSWQKNEEYRSWAEATSLVQVEGVVLRLLQSAERMQNITGGAFDIRCGQMVTLWEQAAKKSELPSAMQCARLAMELRRARPLLSQQNGKFFYEPNAKLPLVLDGLAKGLLIDLVVEQVQQLDGVKGVCFEVGGDMRCAGVPPEGRDTWVVAVVDPQHPQDNAKPLGFVEIKEGAIASSGYYARPLVIGDKTYSRIVDPRSGKSTADMCSATVLATTAVAADAWATALCVLHERELKDMKNMLPSQGWIRMGRGGELRISGVRLQPVPDDWHPAPADNGDEQSEFMASQQVNINIDFSGSPRQKERAYMAVWIENEQGEHVRTLEISGTKSKYRKKLRDWVRVSARKGVDIDAVTRATRLPGVYNLVWDGCDDKGVRLDDGTYWVHVETVRKKGPREHLKAKVIWGIPGKAESSVNEGGELKSLRVQSSMD